MVARRPTSPASACCDAGIGAAAPDARMGDGVGDGHGGGLSPALAALAAGAKRDAVPPFEVNIATPDLRPWREGNALPGVWSFAAAASGPHIAVVALVHGNEIAGAAVLDRWLRAGLRPARGRLSLVFANMEAFARFDPADPTASRFVDEDLNRLWDTSVLSGGRRSCELRRARALRPWLDTVDVLLDLHSMLWPSDPLILAGRTERARRLALDLGVPPLVVGDEGHAGGRRLVDYGGFAEAEGARVALLVEAGAHWEPPTISTMEATAAALLRRCDAVALDDDVLPPPLPPPSATAAGRPRLAEVTLTVTATAPGFAFLRPYRGGDVVPERNTLIALDGDAEIRTPHDDCLLVMPSLRTAPGHTAVRLARFVEG
jgi:Succinylglutamate desuccinylase / Aspartoacylase family